MDKQMIGSRVWNVKPIAHPKKVDLVRDLVRLCRPRDAVMNRIRAEAREPRPQKTRGV